MSKVSSEHLFRLVKSLSKSEKRQIKLLSSRINNGAEKKFIQLFDAIDKTRFYDDEKILKKAPSISRAQLPNLKVHLYDQILKTLRFMDADKDERQQVVSMIANAQILYNKCLYRDALVIIDKAKKKARDTDRKELLLEILQLENNALRSGMTANIEKRTDDLIRAVDAATQSIQTVNVFSNLAFKLNSYYQRQGFIRNRAELQETIQYFNQSLPRYNEHELSTLERSYLYYAFIGFYLYVQDFKKAHQVAKKWVAIFEDESYSRKANMEMYIRAVNSLLVCQNKLLLYNEFVETHRKLVSLKREPAAIYSSHINLNLFKTIYLHEINRHFMIGEFRSGTRVVARLRNELEELVHLLDKNTILIFYYKIACLYVGSENFKTALKWLNLIVQEHDTTLREDLHSFARILRLICYFELGDAGMVEMNLRSTYRFLLRKKELGKYELNILQFLRRSQEAYTRKEILNNFSVLKDQMVRLTKERFERRAFIYFDIISYLESRINGKSIEETVKQKLG